MQELLRKRKIRERRRRKDDCHAGQTQSAYPLMIMCGHPENNHTNKVKDFSCGIPHWQSHGSGQHVGCKGGARGLGRRGYWEFGFKGRYQ